jgi:hypothetical protein
MAPSSVASQTTRRIELQPNGALLSMARHGPTSSKLLPRTRLEEVAAAAEPPCTVESHRGDEMPPPLVRAVLDLTSRNLREFGVSGAELKAKHSELCHPETSILAVRSPAKDVCARAPYAVRCHIIIIHTYHVNNNVLSDPT